MRSSWVVFVVLLWPLFQVGCGSSSRPAYSWTGGMIGSAGDDSDGAAVVGSGGTGGGAAGGNDSGGTSGTDDAALDVSLGSGDVAIDSGGCTVASDTAIDATANIDSEAPSIDVGVSLAPDYLIVAANGLGASAKRYRDFRRAAGFNVDLAMVGDIVGNAADAATASARIVDHVRTLYRNRDTKRPMYLLLLGDAQADWPGDHTGVPAGIWTATDSTSAVVSDNVYADMDGDDIPDLAVGRITADSDAEADLVRAKVAAYETTHDAGVWDRRLDVFSSTSGMGTLVDSVIESVVYDIIEAIPYDYDVTMTYARQASPYVYVPEKFSDQVYSRINEGALLVAYVGHGYRDGFASLDWSGTSYPILDTSHLENLAVTHKSPILLFVACSTGAFVGTESVSERILAKAGAPSAIFSSTEISDPYANAIFIYEVSQAFTVARARTVGDAFVQAKQRMLGNSDTVRQQIDSLAGLLVAPSARDTLKHSHLHMYTLFGDPGMSVRYSGVAKVAVTPSSARAGSTLTVRAEFPALAGGGEAIVTLESARAVILNPIAPVPADGDATRDGVIVQNYQAANDKVVTSVTALASGAWMSTQLTVPADLAAGDYHIKVFLQDGSHDYTASAPIKVE